MSVEWGGGGTWVEKRQSLCRNSCISLCAPTVRGSSLVQVWLRRADLALRTDSAWRGVDTERGKKEYHCMVGDGGPRPAGMTSQLGTGESHQETTQSRTPCPKTSHRREAEDRGWINNWFKRVKYTFKLKLSLSTKPTLVCSSPSDPPLIKLRYTCIQGVRRNTVAVGLMSIWWTDI